MSDDRILDGRSLAESSESVAELLRAAAHPARVRVLSLLSEQERGLSFLVAETRLSKNALVNHLTMLMGVGLVQRASRGRYALTPDGRQLVEFVARAYMGSRQRAVEERRMMRALYASGSRSIGMSESKMVSKPAEHLPCWLSYTGAMAGCLRSLGVDCDVVDVGGMSGYAFILNVAKGRTSPAGPTALGTAWKDVHRGTESLGCKLEHWWEDHSYPRAPDKPTPEEVKLAKRVFDMVRNEIDNDRPVVLWGLHAPEYGIVNGYHKQSYLVSTFRHLIDVPEDPILYYDLKATGCMDAYMFRERLALDRKGVEEELLERAARLASGSFQTSPGFVSGPPALSEWADVLTSGRKDIMDYFGHTYALACWTEGREMAMEFTKRLAKRIKGKRSEELMQASACYAQEHRQLSALIKDTPFVMEERELGGKQCTTAARALRDARRHEESALEHLERALRF